MLPTSQQYCLRWKYHHSNLQTMFSQLLDRGCFCDVTLSCEGQILKAHRVVLCACSTYFDTLLTNCSSEKDPIIIMKDVKFMDIKCLIEFMYKGEINVEHSNLASLLKTAEDLRIKGLAEVSWREDECNNNSDEANNEAESNASPSHQQHLQQLHQLQQMHQKQLNRDSPVPNLPHLAPITTTHSKENGSSVHHIHHQLPLGKKRRGRPPLDDKYDSLSSPKMSHIESATAFTDSSQLVSVTMDDSSRDHTSAKEASYNANSNPCPDLQIDFEEDGISRKIIPKIEMLTDSQPDFVIRDDDEDFSGPLSPSEQNTSLQAIFLTAEEQEEWKDVIKMEDYLTKGRRPQFWEETFTKKVMDAIKTKNLEMKKAAKLLGVSYGTLYGRYRETYGCLKHPYRSPFVNTRLRDVWPPSVVTSTEQGAAEILAMLHRGHITLERAAELMNTSAATVTTYLDQMQDLFTPLDAEPDDSVKQQTMETLLESMNENTPHNVTSRSPSSVSIKLTKKN